MTKVRAMSGISVAVVSVGFEVWLQTTPRQGTSNFSVRISTLKQ